MWSLYKRFLPYFSSLSAVSCNFLSKKGLSLSLSLFGCCKTMPGRGISCRRSLAAAVARPSLCLSCPPLSVSLLLPALFVDVMSRFWSLKWTTADERDGVKPRGSTQDAAGEGKKREEGGERGLSAALNANSDDRQTEREREGGREVEDGSKKFAHHNW